MVSGSTRSPNDTLNLRSRRLRARSRWFCFTQKSHISSSRCVYAALRPLPQLPLTPRQTQTYVRLYNLSEQKLIKTLMPGIKWISSMSVHPSGDHIIVGGYDRKLCWFDLELSDKPYKILRSVIRPHTATCCAADPFSRYHTRAIRSLQFHPTYPLFASSSDDGTIQIFHARTYNDLMTDPLIVPLKILRGHTVKDGLGVLQVEWVHRQPWLLSAGADGKVDLWCS